MMGLLAKDNWRVLVVCGVCLAVWLTGSDSAARAAASGGDRDLQFMGEEAARRGDYLAALRIWRKLLQERPNDPQLLLRLGVTQSLMGRYKEAEASFRRGQALAPGNAQFIFNLGVMYLRKGDLDRAEKLLKETIRINPTLPGANEHLGILYEKRGEPARARKYFMQGLNTNVGSLSAWSWVLSRPEARPRQGVSNAFAVTFLAVCLALSGLIWLAAWRTGRWPRREGPAGLNDSPPAHRCG